MIVLLLCLKRVAMTRHPDVNGRETEEDYGSLDHKVLRN
jgi:hypothetical protein